MSFTWKMYTEVCVCTWDHHSWHADLMLLHGCALNDIMLSFTLYPLSSCTLPPHSQMQYFSQPMSQWGPYYHGDPNYIPYMNGYHPPQGFGMLILLSTIHTFCYNIVNFVGAPEWWVIFLMGGVYQLRGEVLCTCNLHKGYKVFCTKYSMFLLESQRYIHECGYLMQQAVNSE